MMIKPQIATPKSIQVEFYRYTPDSLPDILIWGDGVIESVTVHIPESDQIITVLGVPGSGNEDVYALPGQYIVKHPEGYYKVYWDDEFNMNFTVGVLNQFTPRPGYQTTQDIYAPGTK